jgi:hypothetical protein
LGEAGSFRVAVVTIALSLPTASNFAAALGAFESQPSQVYQQG